MTEELDALNQGLAELAQDTSVGKQCCQNIVTRLGRLLGVRYVFVGLLEQQAEPMIETLAVAVDGAPATNMAYDLAGTPCANVVGQSMCVYPREVTRDFPQDQLLQDMGVSSYLGAPIFDTEGRGTGLLVLLDDKPMADSAQLRSLVQTCAARAGVEIDRMRYEQRLESLSAALEAEVTRRTAELEEANRHLAAFAYSISHDLRAPLRHIMGYGQMMSELPATQADTQAAELAQAILRAGRQLASMMESLLDYSRDSQAHPSCEWIDLSDLISEVLSQLRADAPASLSLSVAVQGRIWADPSLIRVVLFNLIGNAIKYSRREVTPRVSITSRRRADQDELIVEDNGVGFDMRHADRLFAVFQRLHGEREFPGHGVGLASAMGIVKRHGGQIIPWSVPGQGARFVLTLPRPEADDGQSS